MSKESRHKSDDQKSQQILITYDGNIYDVSESDLWKDGIHMSLHQAGQDLTEHMPMAPHGSEVLERFRVVGKEADKSVTPPDKKTRLKKSLTRLYKRFHFHPVSVHFPIALFIFSVITDLLYLLFGRPSPLATTSFHAFLFATAVLPITIGTGFFSWWLNYNLTLTPIFKKKIGGSLTLLALVITCLRWRLIDTFIISDTGPLGWLYHCLLISIMPLMVFIGYQGGKITFPR